MAKTPGEKVFNDATDMVSGSIDSFFESDELRDLYEEYYDLFGMDITEVPEEWDGDTDYQDSMIDMIVLSVFVAEINKRLIHTQEVIRNSSKPKASYAPQVKGA